MPRIVSESDQSFDRIEVDNNTAVATGYGTFEFGLLRASVIAGGNAPMQALLTEAMKDAAPLPVKKAGAQEEFARDFLDFAKPSLAYRKMKERKSGSVVEANAWYGGWTTNGYFKKAKSDFAFHLQKKLDELGTATASEAFTVPRYIKDAIEFVIAEPLDEEPGDVADK